MLRHARRTATPSTMPGSREGRTQRLSPRLGVVFGVTVRHSSTPGSHSSTPKLRCFNVAGQRASRRTPTPSAPSRMQSASASAHAHSCSHVDCGAASQPRSPRHQPAHTMCVKPGWHLSLKLTQQTPPTIDHDAPYPASARGNQSHLKAPPTKCGPRTSRTRDLPYSTCSPAPPHLASLAETGRQQEQTMRVRLPRPAMQKQCWTLLPLQPPAASTGRRGPG